MSLSAFQDLYPDDHAVCYGCGRLNPDGLQIKSYWHGDVAIAHYVPKPMHRAVDGCVYGGLIASLIDCHGIATATADAYRREARAMDTLPAFRYVTAQMTVSYRKPTPLGPELELRARVSQYEAKKTRVSIELFANSKRCVTGEVLAALMPADMSAHLQGAAAFNCA
jgi:acyl-coenzyme A thioesterase PaaI-like protein